MPPEQAKPSAVNAGLSCAAAGVTGLTIALLAALGASFLFVAPVLIEAFADFDTELPALTAQIVSLPRTPVTVGLLVLAVLLVVKDVALRRFPAVALVIGLLVLLAAGAAAAVMVIALFLPYVSMMQSVV